MYLITYFYFVDNKVHYDTVIFLLWRHSVISVRDSFKLVNEFCVHSSALRKNDQLKREPLKKIVVFLIPTGNRSPAELIRKLVTIEKYAKALGNTCIMFTLMRKERKKGLYHNPHFRSVLPIR